MEIDYSKLFDPDKINIEEDSSEIDSILEFQEVLIAISQQIISYRKKNNLTQKELAKKLKVNQTMISKLEKGDYNPTFKCIYNISKKLENSSNMFLEILDNIKLNLNNILTSKYEVKMEPIKKSYKNFSVNKMPTSNIIEISYTDKDIGGNNIYEQCTSSISNVG